jgi:diketogulonate reductase-like aldo/keto reductase
VFLFPRAPVSHRVFRAFKASDKWFPLDSYGVFELANIDPALTYAAMEKLLATGKVRAIGVSNFTIRRLEDLISKTTVVPAVNQIEAHPYLQQPELLKHCKAKNIHVTAYSPLGNNQTGEHRTVDDPLVSELSSKLGIDRGQLLASWGVQRGTIVLPKSVTESRILSNYQVQELPTDVFEQLNGLERHKRFNWQSRWGVDIFEELGDDKVKRIALDSAVENQKVFTV